MYEILLLCKLNNNKNQYPAYKPPLDRKINGTQKMTNHASYITSSSSINKILDTTDLYEKCVTKLKRDNVPYNTALCKHFISYNTISCSPILAQFKS